jgi:Skp family chaperone for outer membrane proteins
MSRQAKIIAAAFVALLLLVGAGFYYVYFYQPGGSAPEAQTALSAPAAPAAPRPQAGPAGKLPDPIILVVDRAGVRRFSKVGQDIGRQLQVMADQARRDLEAQQAQLQKDAAQFQQASPGLTPEQRASRTGELDKRQAALQAAAQRKEAQLAATGQAAFAAVDKVMAPLLQDMVKARGANLVLDRVALPYVVPGMDITADIVAQLDAKMATYKVTLAPAQ